MKIVNRIADLRVLVSTAKQDAKKVSFVPTMGNLHEGHLSLIDQANECGDITICSIFVNPMQFGKNEDLDSYPRTMEADCNALEQRGCDIVFAPSVSEMYPNGLEIETKVEVPELGNHHCGESRPGHFIGVSTVVTKLFNMVQPDIAVFGQKDYQQLAIIRKMTRDLCMPIEIIGVPTSREETGLARSSRNGYLSNEEKTQAAQLFKIMNTIGDEIKEGKGHYRQLENKGKQLLEQAGFKPDYLNIANSNTLEHAELENSDIVILLAAYLGNTRLIDNMELKLS